MLDLEVGFSGYELGVKILDYIFIYYDFCSNNFSPSCAAFNALKHTRALEGSTEHIRLYNSFRSEAFAPMLLFTIQLFLKGSTQK